MKKEEKQGVEVEKTELVWPGKRKEVERVDLPFQTIETINEPRTGKGTADLLRPLSLDDTWKNRLIWGDNLLIMGSLLKDFAGKINLIYIDPPFATGDDFSFEVRIGDQEVTKRPSAMEVKAYRDTWGKGMQSYLQMMYDRLVLMKELLADDGSIYVHLDWHVGHYVKLLMDEIFGAENFQNEIVWHYRTGNVAEKQFQRRHDSIFLYSKTADFKFKPQKFKEYLVQIYGPDKKISFKSADESEDRFGRYRMSQVDDVWNISAVFTLGSEHLPFPTQKPKALLRRIVEASSERGDLVADFFCGSGTTGATAEELGRQWIMADLGRFAVNTTRKRLLGMGAKPFVVQNLGKYERHRWATKNGTYEDYINFILELYRAEAAGGYKYLHGRKANAFVYIGAVDAPVTLSDIQDSLKECVDNNIHELHVLGWEWEMGLHDLVKDEAEKRGIKLITLQIPREVMELSVKDKNIKSKIQFFELAYLDAGVKVDDKKTTVTLKDFMIPNPDLLPEEVRNKVKDWSDFIDYWAVDWMFDQHEEEHTEEDDTFHNMNQRYRTRKEPKLELLMEHEYEKPGKYNVLVKVIDIFGNDTTKLVEVKVK